MLALGMMLLAVLTTALLAATVLLADHGRRLHEAEVEARTALTDGQTLLKKQHSEAR